MPIHILKKFKNIRLKMNEWKSHYNIRKYIKKERKNNIEKGMLVAQLNRYYEMSKRPKNIAHGNSAEILYRNCYKYAFKFDIQTICSAKAQYKSNLVHIEPFSLLISVLALFISLSKLDEILTIIFLMVAILFLYMIGKMSDPISKQTLMISILEDVERDMLNKNAEG